jgi:prophage antirepressor-like protein
MSFFLTENFEDQVIRIAGTPDAPLFNATDVCGVLGLANSRDALSGLDDDEKASVAIADTSASSRNTITMLHVTESGLYHLAFKSRKAAAKRFRRWVTSEVLPTIRKNGAFHAEEAQRALRDGQRMSLTQWVGTLGLDLRTDARRCSDLLGYVTRAASMLRWYATPQKGQNTETLFQEVPCSVLDLAEGLFIQGTGAWRIVKDTERLPLPAASPVTVDLVPVEAGGTIAQIVARKKAQKLAQAALEGRTL